VNGIQKKGRVAILRVDKTDFKTKTITLGKERYMPIKGSIQEEDVTLVLCVCVYIYVCVCTHTKQEHKYVKQILTDIKGEINTIIVGNINTSLTSIDRPSRQKIN